MDERFFLFSYSTDFVYGLNETKWEVHFLFAVFSKFILKSSALTANGEQQNIIINFKYAQCAQVVSNDWKQQQKLNFCCLLQTWFLAFIFSLCKQQIISAAEKKNSRLSLYKIVTTDIVLYLQKGHPKHSVETQQPKYFLTTIIVVGCVTGVVLTAVAIYLMMRR